MKNGAIPIDAVRGSVVEEAAVVEALCAGAPAGAVRDPFGAEHFDRVHQLQESLTRILCHVVELGFDARLLVSGRIARAAVAHPEVAP